MKPSGRSLSYSKVQTLFSEARRRMADARHNPAPDNEDKYVSFALDLAHEIKNPLASMHSAIDALGLIRDEPTRAELIAVVNSDLHRMERLVSDMGRIGALDFDLTQKNRSDLDFRLVVNAAVERMQLKHSDARIDVQLPSRPVWLNSLPGPLTQVIENLLLNALSFSPPESAVSITLRQDKDVCLFAVQDQGKGIAKDHLEQVFERFFTLRPVEHFGQNSGLGLSICRRIVTALDGAIWAASLSAESDMPEGACLCVALPCRDDC